MSVMNIKLGDSDFENYKKSVIIKNVLKKKGFKVALIYFDMYSTGDIDFFIKKGEINKFDKFIFVNLKFSNQYVLYKIPDFIEKILDDNKDIIMVGEVPDVIKKYVNKQINSNDLFKKINGNKMKFLKTFESFRLEEPSTMSELLEKLSVVEQNILDSVKAELINIDTFFNENISKNNLDQLIENAEFNKLLRMKGLKRSDVEHTNDYETFLLNPFKYILISDKNKNELQDPDFIIIQTFNSTEQDWNSLKMYKINGEFKNFYDKLSSRTIELEHDGVNYIYQTSNKNEWELTNQKETERFPRFVRKEDLLNMINNINESSEIMSFINSIESDKNYNKIIYLYDGQKIVVFFIESYRESNIDDFMELEGMMDIFVTSFSEHDNMVKNLYNIENVQGLKTNNKIENSMLEKVSKFIEKGGNFSDFKLVSFDTI